MTQEQADFVSVPSDLQAEWGNVTGQKPRFANAGVVALSNIQKNSEAVKAFLEMEGGSIELESVDDDAKARFEELLKR